MVLILQYSPTLAFIPRTDYLTVIYCFETVAHERHIIIHLELVGQNSVQRHESCHVITFFLTYKTSRDVEYLTACITREQSERLPCANHTTRKRPRILSTQHSTHQHTNTTPHESIFPSVHCSCCICISVPFITYFTMQ